MGVTSSLSSSQYMCAMKLSPHTLLIFVCSIALVASQRTIGRFQQKEVSNDGQIGEASQNNFTPRSRGSIKFIDVLKRDDSGIEISKLRKLRKLVGIEVPADSSSASTNVRQPIASRAPRRHIRPNTERRNIKAVDDNTRTDSKILPDFETKDAAVSLISNKPKQDTESQPKKSPLKSNKIQIPLDERSLVLDHEMVSEDTETVKSNSAKDKLEMDSKVSEAKLFKKIIDEIETEIDLKNSEHIDTKEVVLTNSSKNSSQIPPTTEIKETTSISSIVTSTETSTLTPETTSRVKSTNSRGRPRLNSRSQTRTVRLPTRRPQKIRVVNAKSSRTEEANSKQGGGPVAPRGRFRISRGRGRNDQQSDAQESQSKPVRINRQRS